MLNVNDVVQIVPEHDFGGFFATIYEIKGEILKCYIPSPEGLIYVRLTQKDCEFIGKAAFVLNE